MSESDKIADTRTGKSFISRIFGYLFSSILSGLLNSSKFIPSEEIKKFCEDFYADSSEWLYSCGKRICTRIYLWADGFYKACTQLGI